MDANDILKALSALKYTIRDIVTKDFGTPEGGRVVGRGKGGDDSTVFDVNIEDEVLRIFKSLGNVTVVSEECGECVFGEGGMRAVVDPLDGSKNAIAGIPLFAVSIGISMGGGERLGDVDVAYVLDPIHGDEFTAVKGQGSYHNGKRLLPRQNPQLGKRRPLKRLGIELSPRPERAFKNTEPLLSITSSARCLGSIALDLCYVACGRLDAAVDMRGGLCRTLDIAAAYLILHEAGGVVTDARGGSIAHLRADNDTRTDIIAAPTQGVLDVCLGALS